MAQWYMNVGSKTDLSNDIYNMIGLTVMKLCTEYTFSSFKALIKALVGPRSDHIQSDPIKHGIFVHV